VHAAIESATFSMTRFAASSRPLVDVLAMRCTWRHA
jgi:hypothetical protein